MKNRKAISLGLIVAWVCLFGVSRLAGQEPKIDGKTLSPTPAKTAALDAADWRKAAEMINRGLAYLASQRQGDGGWSMNGAHTPAITALVLKALVQHPDFNAQTPIVRKGFDVLLGYQQPDGAIYDPRQGRSNYSTAIAVCALQAAGNPAFKPAIDKAVTYLRGLQIRPGSESPDGKTIDPKHPYLGGVSYGRHGRPDLNNLGWWMEAMHQAQIPPDDPDMQRALRFVCRCQNRSESNPMAWARQGPNDGGFIYAPARREVTLGESEAGPGPESRGLASYGSITYTAWKSMLYAGLGKDDPRVRAVYGWICRHWTLQANPNMPKGRDQQGVYFYYLVLARALRAWGQDEIPGPGGRDSHNWRKELIEALARRIRKDGSFANDRAGRWGEGNPVLATAYIVQALQEALKR